MKREQILWFLAVSTGVSAIPVAIKQEFPPLRFSRNGTFQIAVFEDLHYGEAEDLDWGPAADVKSTRVMNTILDTESPNLVVLNGDLITGENTFLENSTHYLDEIVVPLVQRGIPWASTYGNHDIEYNLSTKALLARESRYPLSLTRSMIQGSNTGVSNYYLPVYSSDAVNPTLRLLLWFFDSRGGKAFQKLDKNGNQVFVPGNVDNSVVEWFTSTNSALQQRYNRTIPSLAFVHIPVHASFSFQQEGVDPHKEPGINDDNPLAHQGITCVDNVCSYTGQDIPFMSALVKTPGMMAMFSGHDHGNDWCFRWDSRLPDMNITGNGMALCFGRHTGYGGYGSWTRGSRQIFLDEDSLGKSVETWIRLEDRSISGAVMLNNTYGLDEYPAVNKTYT
ncbi:Metallo-dependent phosphatase [Glonium stellatum]|uniref:Metallo-dependent phosphatase n=1 Tax=Glonium stellatum TaxID=574774 RepID=A0A8E2F892_9PEZI|nr:Metallo-dependent phosphatase [Glonium stellatum]